MDELTLLEKKVESLIVWKNNLIKERLSYPIDQESRKELNKGVLVFKESNNLAITGLGTDLICLGLEILINNRNRRLVFATYPLYVYTIAGQNAVDNDYLTYAGGFVVHDNDVIALTTSGFIPSGLDILTYYYVINATNNTFKVSLTQGGGAVNITDQGNGIHYFAKIT